MDDHGKQGALDVVWQDSFVYSIRRDLLGRTLEVMENMTEMSMQRGQKILAYTNDKTQMLYNDSA